MDAEIFKERKNLLEEFYKQRIKFNIFEIKILQDDKKYIYDFSFFHDRVNFETHIKITTESCLIDDYDYFERNLKPIKCYALSYTMLRKFFNPDIILIEDNCITKKDYGVINYTEFINDYEVYVKGIEIIISSHYDFSDVDCDLYFNMLEVLEENNELTLSYILPNPDESEDEYEETNEDETDEEEPKIINPSKIFKSEECIVCLENQPIILFCNCGHIPICTECYKLKSLSACPICKTENEIIRMLE